MLMESYVSEKLPVSQDSVIAVKLGLYDSVFAYHKIDSNAFYSTLRYYQSHPRKFSAILHKVDSTLNIIKPGDTTVVNPSVVPPPNINQFQSFKVQEKLMGEEYLKNIKRLQKDKRTQNNN